MDILISVDMEGIAGVVAEDHTNPRHKEFERFRRLMTAETSAAIEGTLAGGAERILVNDGHGGMANLLIEEMNSAAALISGSPKPLGMMQGISEDADAVFFVGYHAAAERALKLNPSPFVIRPPITIQVVFQRAQHADMAELVPGSVRVDGRTLDWTGDDIPTAYRTLRAMMALSSMR